MKFYEKIIELLKSNPSYCDREGKLNKAKIADEAHKNSIDLLKILLSDNEIKTEYFQEVEGVKIFLKDKFLMMLQDKNFLLDSYTSFKNKIGLADGQGLIKENGNVVLNFPFKDCTLEGGQSKDDDKRRELFFNEVLAKDELDRLLDPKGFVNVKRITKDGETPLSQFTLSDDKREIKDNLLIKGNNLLALHSLKKRFAGKVKLIYIDPPYNTENDSFNYNDSFNHSTWLVFMKNRLEIAKELLREDGVIFVQCDDNEQAYLKVLMDEVFGRENFQTTFYIKARHENRILRSDSQYQKVFEQIHIYSKTSEFSAHKRVQEKKDIEQEYRWRINITSNDPVKILEIGGFDVEVYSKDQYELLTDSKDGIPLKEYNIRGSLITQSGSASEFYELNLRSRKKSDGLGTLYKVINMGLKGDGLGYRLIRQPFDENGTNGFYYQGVALNRQEEQQIPYANFIDIVEEAIDASDEGSVRFKNGKKPEPLLFSIIDLATQEGDIVLDFFAGSGTTAAVAHKMKRQWITIEQMDYIEDITKARLKKVLEGEQGGISKSVNWAGGGDFVYMELAPFNQKYKQAITACKSAKELLSIYQEMKEKAFLDYRYDLQKELKGDKDFTDLSFDEQQKILIDLFDKNQMYVPYTEIEDTSYGIPKDDITASHKFYGGK